MKKSKEQKQREALAALLGLDVPTETTKIAAYDASMEAEAALEYYENPRTFNQKNCKTCGRAFATRGAPVAYCSDKCRATAFEERMGVKWQPYRKVEDRWGFLGEPLTVPPEALAIVQHVMDQQVTASEVIIDEWPGYGDNPEMTPTEEVNVLDLLAELGLD